MIIIKYLVSLENPSLIRFVYFFPFLLWNFISIVEDNAIDEEKPTETTKAELPPIQKEDSKEHINIVFIGHVGTFQ